MDRLFDFLRESWPSPRWILVGGPPLLLLSAASLGLAAWLRAARGWRVGYTRKTFHFLTFAAAAALHATPAAGTPAVCLFGGATSLVVLYAVLRGDGHPAYEALARPADAPHRTWYVVVPYLATLAGGLSANVLAPGAVAVGYLTCGLGDAVGEPVGARWGRHRYRVPLPGRVASFRSLEGSCAVALASFAAVLVGRAASTDVPLDAATLAACGGVALVAALVEAVAPHGWDNLFLILVPALAAQAWVV